MGDDDKGLECGIEPLEDKWECTECGFVNLYPRLVCMGCMMQKTVEIERKPRRKCLRCGFDDCCICLL